MEVGSYIKSEYLNFNLRTAYMWTGSFLIIYSVPCVYLQAYLIALATKTRTN